MSYGNLETLYRQVIMDHYKNPRHKGLKGREGYYTVHLKNPTCGDDITVEIKVENEIVSEVAFDGSGCSISMSAASVMCETVKGRKIEEVKAIFENYLNMLKGEGVDETVEMGDAIIYQGVAKFPARFKCATIAWKALDKALINQQAKLMTKEEINN